MPKILYPFSLLYGAAVERARTRALPLRLPKPVISVGNLTWGGTGKTPVVISLAQYFLSQGARPVVLTRGYFRKSKEPAVVSDGRKMLVSPVISGDEPYLIAESAPGTGVMVGSDRYRSGLRAMEEIRPDIFILDDGFQHWKLHRDLDVLCINALNPFGNGCLIPAGILREPVSAARRAALVLITNTDLAAEDEVPAIERVLAAHDSSAPVAKTRYRASSIRKVTDNTVLTPEYFNRKVVALVSAIGENRGFRKTAEKIGCTVVGHIALRDHYWYNINNLKTFLSRFPKDLPIFITAKDAVRLKDLLPALPPHDQERFFSLDIELEFISGEEQWLSAVQKLLRSS
jgi:tetraacyldisaccharide 4'-kinase